MTTDRQDFGAWAERTASRFLQGLGFEVLESNYRCREGEIDLVAREGRVLAFVEVKARRGIGYGIPAASVDPRKRRRLLRAAARYLSERHPRAAAIRFDVCTVLAPRNGMIPRIELIRGAFESGE